MYPHLLSLGTVLLHPCAGKLPLGDDCTTKEAGRLEASSSGIRCGGCPALHRCLGNLPDGSFASGASAWISPIPVRRPRTKGSHAAHLRWSSTCCRYISSSAHCPYPDHPGTHSPHQGLQELPFCQHD